MRNGPRVCDTKVKASEFHGEGRDNDVARADCPRYVREVSAFALMSQTHGPDVLSKSMVWSMLWDFRSQIALEPER
jgi:hypothetical protein